MIILDKFIEMYEDPDYTIDEIAKEFNIKKGSVYVMAHRYGISRGRYADQGYMKCCKCQAVLEMNRDNFHLNRSSKYNYHNVCKMCISEKHKNKRPGLTEYQKQYLIKNYSNTNYPLEDMGRRLGLTPSRMIDFAKGQRRKGVNIGYRRVRHGKDTRR